MDASCWTLHRVGFKEPTFALKNDMNVVKIGRANQMNKQCLGKQISRTHLEIHKYQQEDGRIYWKLCDPGSSSRVYVNGHVIPQKEMVLMKDKDLISLGGNHTAFEVYGQKRMFLYQCHAPAYQVYSSSSSTETPQQISIKKETENRKRKHTSIKEKSARKKQCKTGEKSSKSFSDMPDEILLKIFSFLDMKHLLRCAQLSKRINPICHDESLWQKVDLAQFKSVSTGLLELLCKNGCKHLSLQCASLKENLTLKNCLSKLRTLDLACFQGPDVAWSVLDVDLEKILDPCHFLQKLDLTGLEIKMKLLRTICLQNWRTLQALKYSFHVDLESIQCIIKNCVQLTEIDFSFTWFDTDAIKFLVRNLSTNTEKLRLSSGVSDEDVKILVSRCNKLKVLDLSHNGITKKSLKSIIANLKHTLEELAIQSTKIDIADLLQLDSNIMPKLRILNCKGDYDKDLDSDLDSDSDSEKGSDEEEENDFEESESLKELKLVLPHLSINENDLEIAEIETDGFLKINSDDIGTDDDSDDDETDDSNAKEELKHF